MSGADTGPLVERFWKKVTKGGPDDCWEWEGYVCKQTGYGRINDEFGQKIGTHRASYLLHFGQIPDGMVVRHKCDNRPCVNPSHLVLGTQKDNVRDMWDRGRAVPPPRWNDGTAEPPEERKRKNALRMGRKRTHCKRGHKLPPHQPGKARRCMEPECREARRYNALGGKAAVR